MHHSLPDPSPNFGLAKTGAEIPRSPHFLPSKNLLPVPILRVIREAEGAIAPISSPRVIRVNLILVFHLPLK